MTFNPSVPLTGDSPGLFPTQGQANFTRLQTIISKDHQFNNTAATNDGYHNIVHLTAQAPDATVVPVSGRLYAKADGVGRLQINYMDDTPTPGPSLNYQVTPSMPIRAAVNFTGTTRNSHFNVASVSNPSTGIYTITFETSSPMPTTNYIVQVTGQMQSAGASEILVGCVAQDGGSWGNAIQTTKVTVAFAKFNGSLAAPITGHITIFSVT